MRVKHAGAEDPRCPIAGLEIPVSRAIEAYREADCPEKFKVSTPHRLIVETCKRLVYSKHHLLVK